MTKEKLKDLRLKSGLSQKQVAEKIGLDNKTISRLESGASSILKIEVRKMLNFYEKQEM